MLDSQTGQVWLRWRTFRFFKRIFIFAQWNKTELIGVTGGLYRTGTASEDGSPNSPIDCFLQFTHQCKGIRPIAGSNKFV